MNKYIPWRIPINNLGFGLFSMGMINIFLRRYDPPLVTGINVWDPNEYNLYCKFHTKETALDTIYDAKSQFTIWHPSDLRKPGGQELYPNKIYLGMTHFETDLLKKEESEEISHLHRLAVCSKWAKKVVETSAAHYKVTCPDTWVIPGPVNSWILPPKDKWEDLRTKIESVTGSNKLMYFSSGKWEVRKSHPEIIDAFNDSEITDTLVGLWHNPFTGGLTQALQCIVSKGFVLQTTGSFYNDKIHIFKNKRGAHIVLLPRIEDYEDVLRLTNMCDIYLALSKGEGWDMPAVEAMGLRKPVILSLNTAHLDYGYEDHIDEPEEYRLTTIKCTQTIAKDDIWFHGTSNWYSPCYPDIVTALHQWRQHMECCLEGLGAASFEAINRAANHDNTSYMLGQFLTI